MFLMNKIARFSLNCAIVPFYAEKEWFTVSIGNCGICAVCVQFQPFKESFALQCLKSSFDFKCFLMLDLCV